MGSAAGEARRDFASNATVWNAYACDDAVIAALLSDGFWSRSVCPHQGGSTR
jgi:hypothetical protein